MLSTHVAVLLLPGSFEARLSAAQARVPGAAEAFIATDGEWVERTTAALCRRFGVPSQDSKDAMQETYRRLLDPNFQRFAADRGDGKGYVRGVILNAIDFAGRRRRRTQGTVSIDADESNAEVVDVDWRAAFDGVDARLDLSRLARRADALVTRAMELIRSRELSQREAAREIGVSEFKLSRALAKFSARVRPAA
jgi:DNA-directed RNA polymerase specialized sigma24 family protein